MNRYRFCTSMSTETMGMQCPLGALSSKPTAWLHVRVDVNEMPGKCSHLKRKWLNHSDGSVVLKRHRATVGTAVYELQQAQKTQMRAWETTIFVSASLAAHLVLLNRFLVVRMASSVYRDTRSKMAEMLAVTFATVGPVAGNRGSAPTKSCKLGYSNSLIEKI